MQRECQHVQEGLGVEELEFEALMRMLDNSGFRSGYTYIEPLVKKETARQISDVELPSLSTTRHFESYH